MSAFITVVDITAAGISRLSGFAVKGVAVRRDYIDGYNIGE
jgi:hypothetical protein